MSVAVMATGRIVTAAFAIDFQPLAISTEGQSATVNSVRADPRPPRLLDAVCANRPVVSLRDFFRCSPFFAVVARPIFSSSQQSFSLNQLLAPISDFISAT
jgi:hypothetical protein